MKSQRYMVEKSHKKITLHLFHALDGKLNKYKVILSCLFSTLYLSDFIFALFLLFS